MARQIRFNYRAADQPANPEGPLKQKSNIQHTTFLPVFGHLIHVIIQHPKHNSLVMSPTISATP